MAAYEAGVSSSSTESSAVVLLAEEASSAATVPRLLDVILASPTLLTPLCSTEHNVSTSTLQLSEEDNREQCSVTKANFNRLLLSIRIFQYPMVIFIVLFC